MKDDIIKNCAKFRSKERIPALCYAIKTENKWTTLWRSS